MGEFVPNQLLVIGYGNSLRCDDGVGRRVAEDLERLKLPGVRTMTCDLLTPELAETVASSARVIFVDAAVDAPSGVQLRPLAPAESSRLMAHAADPRELLALSRDVFGQAPKAWWLTVPVEDLGLGEQLSALASHGAGIAVEKIKNLLPCTR